MFLHANRHNHSHLLERTTPDVAPRQLSQVEDYIEAHAARAIAIDELVAVGGVSALCLFRAFKKTRGRSPMDFANAVRLRRARDMLQHPDAATTVAAVAATCGYADLGRFERDYARSFGELPRQTLAHAGAGPSVH
jgi:transcriptional regulator GlxA family with amidase domain